MFDLGLRLKNLRIKYKMSQAEFGKRICRSKSVISSYENNIKVPPMDIMIDIASMFNVSLDYLVGIEKAEMIPVNKLTDSQRELVQTIVFELADKSKSYGGLTTRQQGILSGLMVEFSKKQR